jgi:hypothetical protein
MRVARFAWLVVAAFAAGLLVAAPSSAESTDPSAPSVLLVSPDDDAFYYQGQSVQAAYACFPGDPTLPVVSCTGDLPLGALLDTSRVGTWSFTVRAQDYAGTVTTLTHSYTVIDVIPPTITIVSPADRAVYPLGAAVSVDFSCDDGPGGSGVLACLGRLPSGTQIESGSPLPTDQLGTFSVIVTGFDNAGNQTTVQHVYQVVDVTPPTITITQPAAVADALPIYRVGQIVYADYSCADAGGIVSCNGSVPSGTPLDTSFIGLHRFIVTASDRSQNSASAVRSYQVVYDFDGFAAPLVSLPAFASVRAGDSLPVKFSLHGDFGLAAVTGVSSQAISCSTGTAPGDSAPAAGTLGYSAGPDRYTFQWSTDRSWLGSCRQLAVTLLDGTMHRANVRFTK